MPLSPLRALIAPATRVHHHYNMSLEIRNTIGLIQMRSTNDVARNLSLSSKIIRRAVSAGAQTVFLPEAADFIATSDQECHHLSSPLSGHAFAQGLQALAKELEITIFAGVHELPEAHEDALDEPFDSLRVFNTHILIGPRGHITARYRKLHMFDILLRPDSVEDGTASPAKKTGESLRIRPGQEIIPPQSVSGLGRIGMEICYDLRFPELQAILTRQGAQLLAFPSAFTVRTGRDHWATLLRATAIQYQVFVVAPAQYGVHNPGRTSWGETLAFDPWGRPLGRLRSMDDDIDSLYDEDGEFLLVMTDMGKVTEIREQIPLDVQKRRDIYGMFDETGRQQ